MPSEPVHHRKEKRRYSLILVPSGESSLTKTFSFGKLGAVVILSSSLLLIIGIVISVILFTPIGSLLPIQNPEMEQKYHKQIIGIQKQVNSLLDEMIVLREYNTRLRKAMGEEFTYNDDNKKISEQADSLASQQNKNFSTTVQQKSLQGDNSTSGTSGTYPNVKQSETVSSIDQNYTNESSKEFYLSTPVSGYISKGFDIEGKHFGIDFAGKLGSPIIAAANGRIIFADWTYDYGYMIMIAHADGYITVYKHNQSILKKTGAVVKRGEPIAILGNTGKTSHGPHLHFELWQNGIVYDPNNYLLIIQ